MSKPLVPLSRRSLLTQGEENHLQALVDDAENAVEAIRGRAWRGKESEPVEVAIDELRRLVRRMQGCILFPEKAAAAIAEIESGFAGLVAMREAAVRNGIDLGPVRQPCRLCGDRGGDTVTPADPCPMCGKERS